MNRCKTMRMVLVFLIVGCCNISLNADARIMIEMHTATGVIANVSDKVITLEDGHLFYPGKNSISPPLNSGIIITIRYYVEADGTYHYMQVALGKNALSLSPPGGGNNFKKETLK